MLYLPLRLVRVLLRGEEEMDSPYAHLLEKTRLPQPSFQRFAVISIFQKLKSASPRHGLDSDPGRDALSRCLGSASAAVTDQAVRELCRLVTEGHLKPSLALVELQSALEGCDPRFVAVFVKGIGFLCRFAFRTDPSWGRRFDPPELHPFVKVLSCPGQVQAELIRQVLLFIVHNKSVGMEAVSGFLRPFLIFSVLRKPFSFTSSSFAREVISSLASLSCSLPSEAICIIKLLTDCLKYFPNNNEEEFKYLISSAECLVDAFVVVLKQMDGPEKLLGAAHTCVLELLETLLSLCTCLHKPRGGTEIVLELLKRLLVAQKWVDSQYLPEFVIIAISLSLILTQVEFEYEQLSILKLLIFLIEWKTEKGYNIKAEVSKELLVIFPVIKLLSSPSRSVKATATYLLSAMEELLLDLSVASSKPQIVDAGFPSISKTWSIPYRLLYHLWFQEKSPFTHIYFLDFTCSDASEVEKTCGGKRYWTSQLTEYVSNAEKYKFTSVSQSPERMSLLLSSVASILAMHPMIGGSAIESLAGIGVMDPKLGMPLLLSVLFYNKMLCCHEIKSPEILLRFLELLPSLALHSDMVPFIFQTILPMLQRDAKPVLYATAVRLLCKTWIVTDRAFATLQGFLDPKAFSDFIFEREICISIAASIREVCKHNPDRGIDLILSVSSCIESRVSSIQALGFESLAHLCEADVVDFYTAWDVISKHMLDYSSDPIVANGLCTLLRWGALDAEAYAEASKIVLQILWEVATSKSPSSKSLWVKARVSAFKSLSHYEVVGVQKTIIDFKKRNLQCLLSEECGEVLTAMEEFELKLIDFEYITRHRVRKEKRVKVHKIEKLLEVFPQVMFSPGKQNFRASELPGAALLSLVFTPKDLNGQGTPKDLLYAAYENALKEIAESFLVSRNILVSLLALQSWRSFIHRWMRAMVMFANDKVQSNVSDKGSKVARDIFKTMSKVAAESIPQVAVNIALAMGALCMVVPPSADAVISAASNFLLKWLFEYEHEHKQWSAAISLGLVSNCFHATDRKQKFEVINGLLKVLCNSKSHLIKGACGTGLGFACQNLLTRVEIDDSIFEGRTDRLTETTLVHDIIRTLSLMICQLCPSATDSLRSLNESFPLDGDNTYEESASDLPRENCDNLDEDSWGVAGLVVGLGNAVVATYRSGAYDTVLKIKNMLISWIPDVDSFGNSSFICNNMAEIPLSMGSCLALPIVVAFCQKTEMMDNDLDVLLKRYVSLISALLNLKKSGTLHQNLLMTSCLGAGSFLSCIMKNGVHSMRFDDVKHLMEILRSTYTNPFPPTIHLGGMLGVVNAFGAGAGDLTHNVPLPTPWQINYEQVSDFIRGPILSSPICETLATSMVQEIFLVAKDCKDQHKQRYAAWAVSFLRQQLSSEEFQNANGSQLTPIDSNPTSQSFAEDSIVWKLCLWLRDINHHKTGEITHATTIATVLRCLSKAPRLPTLDWGAIIRRCMRYEVQFSVKMYVEPAPQLLREECIRLSLAHAKNVRALLLFLDDVTDLSRFRTLELNLQSTVLHHLPELLKIFSGLRLEKLFEDLLAYFSSSSSSYLIYELDQKSFLRVSFWKGLHLCLTEASKESIYMSMMEKCMECLFYLLPELTCSGSSEGDQADSIEWLEAMRCLSKAPQDWLVDFLEVLDISLFHSEIHFVEVAKHISARARLVRNGCFPISELGKIKGYILNARSEGIWWNVLVEVVAAVSREGVGIKKQWLLDALETSCMSEYPSTALRFVALLSGSCSVYMPLLIIDPITILSDLPVTLPSLLSDSHWSSIAESLANKLWSSTERICSWAARVANGDVSSDHDRIDGSEASISAFLAHVMHQACVSLIEYLSFEKQLRLANLEISRVGELPLPSLCELRQLSN